MCLESFSAGSNHFTAVANGRVFTWGTDTDGCLGQNEAGPTHVASPLQISMPFIVRLVSCGSVHTLALSEQGVVFSWGVLLFAHVPL